MPPTLEQRDRALLIANTHRLRFAGAKREVADGRRPIARVLAGQDPDLAHLLIADVLLLVPGFGHRRLQVLGRRACAANVNLMVTLGAAPLRTRQWVAWEMSKHRRRMPVAVEKAAA